MLKRRKRIQKYINALKTKKTNPKEQTIMKYKLQHQQQQQKQHRNRIQSAFSIPSYNVHKQEITQEQENCWHDSDDEQQLHITQRNMYQKLNLQTNTTEKQYQSKLTQFYNKKYIVKNWATEGEGQQEKDLNDYMDQEEIYQQTNHRQLTPQVEFFTRTSEKHNSVVTGLDWHNRVMFTTGYDQKLKVWSLNSEQQNPQLKIKLQKDIYTEKLSLTSCNYNNGEVFCGTLRQNYIAIDCNKWKIKRITSSFLSDHSSYQNFRLSKATNQCLLFSQQKISILDHKNSYIGSVIANEQLVDASFGKLPHQLFALSDESIYEWDLRYFKTALLVRQCLGFTKLSVKNDILATGNRLGVVRLNNLASQDGQHKLSEYSQVSNLVTFVTTLESNKDNTLMLAMSKWKANAVRLIDIHKGKCIADWPTVKTKIGLGSVGSFSDANELGIGSSNGYVTIFKIGKNE